MPSFGADSKAIISKVHPELQRLFNAVVQEWDCKAIRGLATATEQHKLWLQGRGLPGPIVTDKDGIINLSDHQKTVLINGVNYGLALDIAPYPIQWGDTNRFYAFAGYVLGRAYDMEIKIQWGGDWDSDRDLHDQKLYDLDHFAIVL